MDVLRKVYDPERSVPILELKIAGEEEDVEVTNDSIKITFAPTSPYCPIGGTIGFLIKYSIKVKFGKDEIKIKQGTHMQEEMLNEMLNGQEKYIETIKKLEDTSIVERCIKL